MRNTPKLSNKNFKKLHVFTSCSHAKVVPDLKSKVRRSTTPNPPEKSKSGSRLKHLLRPYRCVLNVTHDPPEHGLIWVIRGWWENQRHNGCDDDGGVVDACDGGLNVDGDG
ncbi:hypothetical protein Tco_0077944 [Tanacetum coccineum]